MILEFGRRRCLKIIKTIPSRTQYLYERASFRIVKIGPQIAWVEKTERKRTVGALHDPCAAKSESDRKPLAGPAGTDSPDQKPSSGPGPLDVLFQLQHNSHLNLQSFIRNISQLQKPLYKLHNKPYSQIHYTRTKVGSLVPLLTGDVRISVGLKVLAAGPIVGIQRVDEGIRSIGTTRATLRNPYEKLTPKFH